MLGQGTARAPFGGKAQNARPSGKPSGLPGYAFEVKLIPTVAIFVVLVVAVLLGYQLGNRPAAPIAKVAAVAKKPAPKPAPAPVVDPLGVVVADMNTAIATQPGLSASATLINLNTGKEYDAGAYTQNFEAASTSKLVAIFDYVHQVELGKATFTQSIEGETAQDIIMRMIVYSDNDAWTKLNTYLTMKQEQAYVNSLGVTATIQVDNMQFTTPNMAKLLQLLYQGKLMNSADQAMVYNYMANTTVKNLIQAVLPADATVYHKYGQIDGVLHDASIVEYQGHDFVLVVYTNNADGTASQYNNQVNLIHAVATAAFNDITAP